MWGIAHLPPRSTEKVKERIHMRSMPPNSPKDSNVCHIADSLCTHSLPSQFHWSSALFTQLNSDRTATSPHEPNGVTSVWKAHYAFSLEPSEIRIKWSGLGTWCVKCHPCDLFRKIKGETSILFPHALIKHPLDIEVNSKCFQLVELDLHASWRNVRGQ